MARITFYDDAGIMIDDAVIVNLGDTIHVPFGAVTMEVLPI